MPPWEICFKRLIHSATHLHSLAKVAFSLALTLTLATWQLVRSPWLKPPSSLRKIRVNFSQRQMKSQRLKMSSRLLMTMFLRTISGYRRMRCPMWPSRSNELISISQWRVYQHWQLWSGDEFCVSNLKIPPIRLSSFPMATDHLLANFRSRSTEQPTPKVKKKYATFSGTDYSLVLRYRSRKTDLKWFLSMLCRLILSLPTTFASVTFSRTLSMTSSYRWTTFSQGSPSLSSFVSVRSSAHLLRVDHAKSWL